MTVRFLFVCEGSSDSAFASHIGRLLVESGEDDPQAITWIHGRHLVDKIRLGLRYSGGCDLLFVHRDSDSPVETDSAGSERRRREIEKAISELGHAGIWVSVVPVRMTEAWLLTDESAIRKVVGRPHGNEPLGLPPLNHLETVGNPKCVLFSALLAASGASGRRLRRVQRDLFQLRRLLLEDLPVGGLLEQVPSWVRFRDDLRDAMGSSPRP